jgi:hypothetical protein
MKRTIIALLFLSAPAYGVTFDDGGVHVVDANNSYPFEIVEVIDGPGPSSTVLAVVAGGEIGTHLTLSTRTLQTSGSSRIDISGGFIRGCTDFGGNSVVDMSGGLIERTLYVDHDAEVNISGGEVAFSAIVFGGFVNISGGEVGGFSTGYHAVGGIADISGGIVSEVYLEAQAEAYVSGGEIIRGAETTGDSFLEITGGTWGGPIFAFNDSLIEIYGLGFNYPYGEMTASSGELTGWLLDGTPIDVDFGRASTATIYLPEPQGLAGLFFGWALLVSLALTRPLDLFVRFSQPGARQAPVEQV